MKRKRRKRQVKTILLGLAMLLAAGAVITGIVLLISGPAGGDGGGELVIKPTVTLSATPGASDQTQTSAPQNVSEPAEFKLPYELGNGLVITELNRYAGMFVEDGTDEIVSGVMRLTVENGGESDVQLLNITLTGEDGATYAFELTTLPAGAKLTALEKNRALYDGQAKMKSVSVDNMALFDYELTMHEDALQFTCADKSITVKNIGSEDFAGGRVYYKSVSGEMLIGGITYMVNIPALAAGEEIALLAAHYTQSASRLMFVTYGG